MTKGFKNV